MFTGRLQPTLCPFCGSREIRLSVESEIGNSYRCDNCRLYFSVTYAADPPSYTLTSSTTIPAECDHVWEESKTTAAGFVCRKCSQWRTPRPTTSWHSTLP